MVPESLQLILTHIVPSTLKQVSIGQCITQAARPRSVMYPICNVVSQYYYGGDTLRRIADNNVTRFCIVIVF